MARAGGCGLNEALCTAGVAALVTRCTVELVERFPEIKKRQGTFNFNDPTRTLCALVFGQEGAPNPISN